MGGVCGICSKGNCVSKAWYGAFHSQHLGEEYCGLVTSNGRKIKGETKKGLVNERFPRKELSRLERTLKGNLALTHTSLKVRQPLIFDDFSIAFTGLLHNKISLIKELKGRGHTFTPDHTDIEVLSKLVSQGVDVHEGIRYMAKKAKGSLSVVILNKDAIYAFRGKYGFKPLMVGEGDDFVAVSNTSCALEGIGIERGNYRDLLPGEIVRLSKEGVETIDRLYGDNPEIHVCSFLYSYGERIDAIVEGVSVKKARERMGAALARRDLEEGFKADVGVPIRDSGVGHAIGYHHESGIPYDEGLFKLWYVTRTFIQPEQELRTYLADLKQSPIREAVEGKVVVLPDDSIVRSTTIRWLVEMLKAFGAKEVHPRIATPPLVDVCLYGISTKKKEELAVHKFGSIENIEKEIKADSLRYNTIEDYVESIGLSADKLCLFCCTGKPYEL